MPRPRLQDPRAQVALVALGALAVRAVAIAVWSRHQGIYGDQVFYHQQGQDLADWFGFTYRHPAGERITTAVHPPLHGAVLGLASLLGGESVTAHRLVGAVLGSATALVAGLVGLRLAGRRTALVAAAVVAVAPTLWINDAQVLSESTFALATALVLLAAVELARRPEPVVAAGLGGAIALAALARAEAAALVVLLAVPLLALIGRAAGPPLALRRRLVLGGWLALAGLVVAGPWLVRDLTAFERPALVSTGGGFVLEIASCDATFSGDQLGYWSATCDRTSWEPGDETATEAAKRATALAYVSDHADRLPVVVAARVGRLWDLWRPDQSVVLNDVFERRGRAPSWWAIRAWWAMLALSIPAVWALRRRPALLVPFVAVAASTTLAAAMSFGITRYRTGLEVAVAVLAGLGVDVVARWWSRRGRGRLTAGAAGAAGVAP